MSKDDSDYFPKGLSHAVGMARTVNKARQIVCQHDWTDKPEHKAKICYLFGKVVIEQ